jgi:hypothetical protein
MMAQNMSLIHAIRSSEVVNLRARNIARTYDSLRDLSQQTAQKFRTQKENIQCSLCVPGTSSGAESDQRSKPEYPLFVSEGSRNFRSAFIRTPIAWSAIRRVHCVMPDDIGRSFVGSPVPHSLPAAAGTLSRGPSVTGWPTGRKGEEDGCVDTKSRK